MFGRAGSARAGRTSTPVQSPTTSQPTTIEPSRACIDEPSDGSDTPRPGPPENPVTTDHRPTTDDQSSSATTFA